MRTIQQPIASGSNLRIYSYKKARERRSDALLFLPAQENAGGCDLRSRLLPRLRLRALSSTRRAMARRNRFAALAINDDDDVDVIDALDLGALGYLADPAPAGLFGFLADIAAANIAAANIAAANLAAANHPTANPDPAPVDPLGEADLFGGDEVNHGLEDEDPMNPWKLVTYRGRKCEKDTEDTEATFNENAIHEDSQPAVDVKTAVEVPWVAREGSLRRIRKHAQDRKGGYVQSEEGPGVYVYGTFGPNSLEF